jgi:hypothetical protein
MLFTLVALGTIVSAVERSAGESRVPLSPAEVVAKFHSAPLKDVVLVRFRVRDVADGNPDWTYLYADELPGRNLFAVEFSRAAKAALRQRGVSDLAKHFRGKEVEFAGPIKVTMLWCFPACELYTLRVENLEQFSAIREIDRAGGD